MSDPIVSAANLAWIESAIKYSNDGTIQNAWAEVLGNIRHILAERTALQARLDAMERMLPDVGYAEALRGQIATLEAALKDKDSELISVREMWNSETVTHLAAYKAECHRIGEMETINVNQDRAFHRMAQEKGQRIAALESSLQRMTQALTEIAKTPMRDDGLRLIQIARAALSPDIQTPSVQVAGDYMSRSIVEFNRAVEVLLSEEQEKPNANNALISVLCDAVRLSRENVRLATQAPPPQAEQNGGQCSKCGTFLPPPTEWDVKEQL